ncbi:MAG: hypothetical protein ABIO70_32575 [Pseudomonadota bacterium]
MLPRPAHASFPFLALSLTGCGLWYLEQVADPADATVVDIQPPDELSFGPVSPAGSPVTLEATVSAEGGGRIALESVLLSPDGDGAFTLADDPSPCVVEGEQSAVVEVRFHPDAVGTYIGRLTFLASVGGNDVELTRRLSGTGCNDPDHDGICASSMPGWEPFGPPDDTALR